MPTKNLSDASVKKLKPIDGKRTDYFDTQQPAFGMRVSPTGARRWFVATRPPQGGNPRRISFGAYPGMSLKDARNEARSLLRAAERGEDPKLVLERRKAAVIETNAKSFASIRDDYIEKRAKVELKLTTCAELERLLMHPVLKSLEPLPINEIDARQIRVVLADMADIGATSSNRLRAFLSGMFAWASDRGLCDGNPVAMTRPLAKEKSRERVLTDDELNKILDAAAKEPKPIAQLIEVLCLTGQRRAEVGGIQWHELDLDSDKPLWTLGTERTKNGREHKIPLTPRLVSLFKSIPETGDYVFSRYGTSPFNGFSRVKKRIDEESGVPEWTWHDLRRTFATRLAELKIAPHVIEAALNHVSGHKSGVAGIYNRATYEDEKRSALQAWSNHCSALGKKKASNVVRIG